MRLSIPPSREVQRDARWMSSPTTSANSRGTTLSFVGVPACLDGDEAAIAIDPDGCCVFADESPP